MFLINVEATRSSIDRPERAVVVENQLRRQDNWCDSGKISATSIPEESPEV
jgi:hypothetical protein